MVLEQSWDLLFVLFFAVFVFSLIFHGVFSVWTKPLFLFSKISFFDDIFMFLFIVCIFITCISVGRLNDTHFAWVYNVTLMM